MIKEFRLTTLTGLKYVVRGDHRTGKRTKSHHREHDARQKASLIPPPHAAGHDKDWPQERHLFM